MKTPCRPLVATVALSLPILVCPFAFSTRSTSATQAATPNQVLASPSRQPSQPPAQAKTKPAVVTVNVLVTDEDGQVISGLRPGNFRILDDGVPQKLTHFSPTTAPITIVMLLEYSAASYNYFAAKAASWATGFLSHLEARDWIALTVYDMGPQVRVDFTQRRYEIRDALNTLGPPRFSESNLFDALIDTLDKLDRVRGRKSILLLTTGANSFSSATFDEVIDRLRRSEVTVFVVGLAEEEYVRYQGSSISYTQAKSWLNAIAEESGGLALFPRFEAELPDIFRSVVGFLRNEYTLSFSPTDGLRQGGFHPLKVHIVGPDGAPLKVTNDKNKKRKIEVYTRKGYVAPKESGK